MQTAYRNTKSMNNTGTKFRSVEKDRHYQNYSNTQKSFGINHSYNEDQR